MYETHQLESMVAALYNQATRSSESFRDEYFNEIIERNMTLLPTESRDEFMRIAIDHGYEPNAQYSNHYHPEEDGFNNEIYDDMFPLEDDEWLH